MLKTTSDRIFGYDLARCVAILGMVVVHFSLVMAVPNDQGWLPVLLGFLDGRAAAMFVILSGIGVTLMTQRVVRTGDLVEIRRIQHVLVRRGILLLIFGFLNLRIWPGDILRVYGVSLIIASFLIAASDRRLLFSALAFPVEFIVLMFLLDFEKNWDWSTMTYHRLWTPNGVVRNLFYDGFRSVFPWTGFLLFGMWLGRLELCDSTTNGRVFFRAAAIGMGAEFVSWISVMSIPVHVVGMDQATINALFGTRSMPALPLFLLAAGGTAVAIIAISVRAAEALPSFVKPFADTGQMALTWYVAHIVVGLGGIEALGLVGSQPTWIALGCGLVFFIVAVLLSSIWKTYRRNGPLEWIMRRIAG